MPIDHDAERRPDTTGTAPRCAPGPKRSQRRRLAPRPSTKAKLVSRSPIAPSGLQVRRWPVCVVNEKKADRRSVPALTSRSDALAVYASDQSQLLPGANLVAPQAPWAHRTYGAGFSTLAARALRTRLAPWSFRTALTHFSNIAFWALLAPRPLDALWAFRTARSGLPFDAQ